MAVPEATQSYDDFENNSSRLGAPSRLDVPVVTGLWMVVITSLMLPLEHKRRFKFRL